MIWNVANKTINSSIPMLIIFLVIIIATRITYLVVQHKKFVLNKEFANLVFIIYILLLFQLVTSTDINYHSGVNYIPFTEIFRYKVGSSLFLLNVLGNIAIFIPFGLFISKVLKSTKFLPVFIISFIASGCIEGVQLYIGRAFDVDDIILNCIGSILGWFIYVMLVKLNDRLPKFMKSDLFYDILCILFMIILFWLLRDFIKMGVFV